MSDIVEISIQSDIDACLADVGQMFEAQIPYALGGAINDTLFDVRRRIVESTWQNAFEVRNKRFPGVLFRVDRIPLGGEKSPISAFKYGGVGGIFGSVSQKLPADWIINQVTGGVKKPRGKTIAVPFKPEGLRSPTGRVRKANKPRNIVLQKNTYLVKGPGGDKKFIARRTNNSKKGEIIYVFAKEAKITATFRFFEDGFETIDRVFPRYFGTRFAKAVNSSRFD